ncbi:uncharacterized protein C5orf47 homolog [Alligator mississippiensis]|uniref:uncharacterized protein C5orf47 homolog n=1 Tax=Alligator mississippiensis TaxID=8496 RepID=UPI000906FD11|nr:uncharacterized protein C5orf47 homolog [Alligator mississippiensis]
MPLLVAFPPHRTHTHTLCVRRTGVTSPPPRFIQPSQPALKMKPGSGSGQERIRMVYINSFGAHRCGSVIQYRGGRRCHEETTATPSLLGRHMSPSAGVRKRQEAPTSALRLRDKALAASRHGRGCKGSPELSLGPPSRAGPEGAGLCAVAQRPRSQAGGAAKCRENGTELLSSSRKTLGSSAPTGLFSQGHGTCYPGKRGHAESDLQEKQMDPFGFPFPSQKVGKAIKRKKDKTEVCHGVLKIISKMLEENEQFRTRLMTCSEFSGEGRDVNQNIQNEDPAWMWTSPSLDGCSMKINEDSISTVVLN